MSKSGTTVIGRGIRIQGEVSGSAPIEVWGELEGQAGSEGQCWVREGGSIKGEVAAPQVLVEGKVDGSISASQKVELRATSKVQGDISAPKVAIIEGAFFEGRVKMPKQ